MTLSRRDFLRGLAAGAVVVAAPSMAAGVTLRRVSRADDWVLDALVHGEIGRIEQCRFVELTKVDYAFAHQNTARMVWSGQQNPSSYMASADLSQTLRDALRPVLKFRHFNEYAHG